MRPTILPLTAILLTAAAGPAAAVSLGIPTTRDAPVISGAGAAFHDPLLGFDLLGDRLASSTPPAAATGLFVTVPFADLTAPGGALFVTAEGGSPFLSGDLARTGFLVDETGDDTLELLFGRLDGSAAGGAFGPLALLTLSGEFGADPLGAGFGSFENPVDVDVSVYSAIPLPASLPVLLVGIASLLAFRRKSS